jgi:NB-ARC domain
MDLSALQKLNSPALSSVIPKGRGEGQVNSAAVIFEAALVFVDNLVFSKRGKHLSEAEIIVLKGAWDDDDYEEVAENSPYSLNYLQRRVAPPLWDLLSETIGSGERVGKKKLRRILLEQVTKKYPILSASIGKQRPSANGLMQVIGGSHLPDISSFYGRTKELTNLKELVIDQRCISLIGVAGIGKSALAAKLLTELSVKSQPRFDCLIWKSVSHAPLLQDLITDLIELTQPIEPEQSLPKSTQAMLTVLIKQLQSQRYFIVLDECEALFQTNNLEERLEYKLFFRRLVEEQHKSCLLLTSRVWPNEFDVLIEADRPIQYVRVEGLDPDASMQFLSALGLCNKEKRCSQLIQTYRGNPLELKAVSNRIHHFFASSTERFFQDPTTLVSSRFQDMLNKIFGEVLSKIQRQIMIYLAERIGLNFQYISFSQLLIELKQKHKISISTSELITALEELEKNSLIENIKDPITKEISFTLQPVIKKYIMTDPLGLVHKSETSSTLPFAS